jgi:protein-disulfide isomerase
MQRLATSNDLPQSTARRALLLAGPVTLALTAMPVRAQSVSAPAETPAPAISLTRAVDELIAQDLLSDPASPVLGAVGGDVTIVEFFDYRCPYCKQMAPELPKLRS